MAIAIQWNGDFKKENNDLIKFLLHLLQYVHPFFPLIVTKVAEGI